MENWHVDPVTGLKILEVAGGAAFLVVQRDGKTWEYADTEVKRVTMRRDTYVTSQVIG